MTKQDHANMNGERFDGPGIAAVLSREYGIAVDAIVPQKGGWTSLAYRIEAPEGVFFLKAYEKSRTSIAGWIMRIDDYIPIVSWLGTHGMENRIASPVPTRDMKSKCEDARHVYVLFHYVDGYTIGDAQLTVGQVRQLADIVADLHSHGEELPFPFGKLREDFSLPFGDRLDWLAGSGLSSLPENVGGVVLPFAADIGNTLSRTKRLAAELRRSGLAFVLCHTDLHQWNMMQTKDTLVLIDWEGIRLAPAEADLFMIAEKPFFADFMAVYRRRRNGIRINATVIEYYSLRRKLEDIWEWIEQICHEPLEPDERNSALSILAEECAALASG